MPLNTGICCMPIWCSFVHVQIPRHSKTTYTAASKSTVCNCVCLFWRGSAVLLTANCHSIPETTGSFYWTWTVAEPFCQPLSTNGTQNFTSVSVFLKENNTFSLCCWATYLHKISEEQEDRDYKGKHHSLYIYILKNPHIIISHKKGKVCAKIKRLYLLKIMLL